VCLFHMDDAGGWNSKVEGLDRKSGKPKKAKKKNQRTHTAEAREKGARHRRTRAPWPPLEMRVRTAGKRRRRLNRRMERT
jgi:hypothetical protein